MKKFKILHSQNGWEYTGNYIIECEKSAVKLDTETDQHSLLIDGKVKISFDDKFEIEEVECQHNEIGIVYCVGERSEHGGYYKQLEIRCPDCEKVLFSMSLKNRRLISCIPELPGTEEVGNLLK